MTLWVLFGFLAVAASPGPARAAARAQPLERRVDPRVELVHERTFSTRFGASARSRAVVSGVEIDRARAVVTFDRAGRVVFSDSDVPTFGAVVPSARSDAELWELASRAVPLALRDARGAPQGGLKRSWFAVGGALHGGAWVFVPTPRETDNWHVAVDGVTGRVLRRENRVYTAATDAHVYSPSPGGLDAGVGATPTVAVRLVRADGGPMLGGDGGTLTGPHFEAFNCCLAEGCAPGGSPRVVTNHLLAPDAGVLGRDGGDFDWDAGRVVVRTVVCDRLQRATSDPALHASGDFVYPPVDGPAPLRQESPEYSDPFAEVHAFFHANRMLEWVESLSGGAFRFRDAFRVPAVPMMVQTNFVLADPASDGSAACVLRGFCDWSRFGPLGNAMFVPREQYPSLKLPELYPDRDGVYFFQGPALDFAYDATVVRHELGHAVIQSTAGLRFSTPRVETTWANDEVSALHEGLADFLAAAFASDPEIGRYLGPNRNRTADGPLRTVATAARCPQDLTGLRHEDGLLFSGALWEARARFEAGRFDAALYAALVALAPAANFDTAADAVSTMVALAFPEDPGAEAAMRALFAARGVTGCSHLREVDGGSVEVELYGLAGPPLEEPSGFGSIPGPYQFVFTPAERGGTFQISTLTPGAGLRVRLRAGAPVEVAPSPTGLQASFEAEARVQYDLTWLEVPCGPAQPLYLAFTNDAPWPMALSGLSITWTKDDRCSTPLPALPGPSTGLGPAAGCGCASASAAWPLLGLLIFRRRLSRRRPPTCCSPTRSRSAARPEARAAPPPPAAPRRARAASPSTCGRPERPRSGGGCRARRGAGAARRCSRRCPCGRRRRG